MSTTTDQTTVEAPAAPEVIAGFKIHPAARLLPEPSPEVRARLKADIEQHGLIVPIVLTPAGEILDGRTRARICEELGIKLGPNDLNEFYNKMTVTLDPEEARDPVAYVLSVNAARRHLSGDQVIAVYLEAKKAKIEADKLAAKATQRANLKKGAAQPEKSTMNLSGEILSGETAASKIAKAVGKSESAVKRVQRAKKAAPERFTEVIEGKTSASAILKQEIPEAKPPATKQNRVKAPANGQPVPKKLKPGSRAWFESRISDLESIAQDLRDHAAVSKLTRDQYKRFAKANEDLQHFERIAHDPARVRDVALAVFGLWHECGGAQIETEGEGSRYTMQQVMEAVACELNFDRWAKAIKEMTRIGGQWVTDCSFMDLITVRDGKPLGLECNEEDLREWIADEAAEPQEATS